MPATPEHVALAIEAIYDAASEPKLWQVALDRIAKCVDAAGAVLQDRCEDMTYAMIASPNLQAATELYMKSWAHRDIRAVRAFERTLLVSRGYVMDSDVVTPEEMRTDPIYTEFLPSVGLGYSLAVAISPKMNVVIALGVQRSAGEPPFGSDDIETMRMLGRYVEKSLRLSIRLFDAEAEGSLLGLVLSRLGTGVFMLDANSHVIFSNAAAERAIGRGLKIVTRRLAPRDSSARTLLDTEITAELHRDPDANEWRHKTVLIPEGGELRPLVVYVFGTDGTSLTQILRSFRPNARVIVLVIDQNDLQAPDAVAMEDLFGLTAAEARLAALVATGKSPRDAAELLNITEKTARGVLKKVFSKTGVGKQSELAAVVGRIVLRDA